MFSIKINKLLQITSGIEELSDIFERKGVKINAEDTILKIENNQEYVSLTGNTTSATKIIKQAEERAREGYKEAKLTYVDNAEVGWNFYNDNPWASAAERDALAQAALKELYSYCSKQLDFDDSGNFEAQCIFEDLLNISRQKIYIDNSIATQVDIDIVKDEESSQSGSSSFDFTVGIKIFSSTIFYPFFLIY